MNNITFQGKSDLIFSKKTYNKFIEECEMYRRTGSKRAISEHKISQHKGYSENIRHTDMVVILGNEKDYIVKKFPIKCRTKEVAMQLGEKIEEFKANTQQKLTAWILGGEHHKYDGGATIKALDDISQVLCDRPDIDTSILVGPSQLKTENIVGIRAMCDRLKIHLPIDNATIKAESELENFFDIVELNNVTTEIL